MSQCCGLRVIGPAYVNWASMKSALHHIWALRGPKVFPLGRNLLTLCPLPVFWVVRWKWTDGDTLTSFCMETPHSHYLHFAIGKAKYRSVRLKEWSEETVKRKHPHLKWDLVTTYFECLRTHLLYNYPYASLYRQLHNHHNKTYSSQQNKWVGISIDSSVLLLQTYYFVIQYLVQACINTVLSYWLPEITGIAFHVYIQFFRSTFCILAFLCYWRPGCNHVHAFFTRS